MKSFVTKPLTVVAVAAGATLFGCSGELSGGADLRMPWSAPVTQQQPPLTPPADPPPAPAPIPAASEPPAMPPLTPTPDLAKPDMAGVLPPRDLSCQQSSLALGRRAKAVINGQTLVFDGPRFISQRDPQGRLQYYDFTSNDGQHVLSIMVLDGFGEGCGKPIALPTSAAAAAVYLYDVNPDGTYRLAFDSDGPAATGTMMIDAFSAEPSAEEVSFLCNNCLLPASDGSAGAAQVTGEVHERN